MNVNLAVKGLLAAWRRLGALVIVTILGTCPSFSHAANVFVEEMTWPEVRDAIAAGSRTAILYAGSTEQNGPHMVLGKHNFIARDVAGRIAMELGDALVYPVLPFALTGDAASRSGHMRFPGTVTLRPSTFRAAVRDVAESALAAGFRFVFLAGDHGGGQAELRSVAATLDSGWRRKGARVFHLPDVYFLQLERVAAQLAARGMAAGGHAALADTAELMAVDARGAWVRAGLIGASLGRPPAESGVEGDPTGASAEIGRAGIAEKVSLGVAQIRRLRSESLQQGPRR